MSPGASGNAHEANQLNPGPPPRPKRKLGCKTVVYAFLILLGLATCWMSFILLRGASMALQHPHFKLYQDLKDPYRPQDVVRPLVDGNQTFDIVATVWLRTEVPDTDVAESEGAWNRWSERGLILHEKPIFSETVFKGLHLKDKRKKTSINLQVPTEIFKRRDLNNYDLRASFVLVPTPPSPLDNATEYSSWMPASAMYPPVRSWPHDYKPSIAEEIVDSYGTFMPLLAFHNIHSRCPKSADSSDEDDVNEEEDEEKENDGSLPLQLETQNNKWKSVADQPVLKAHPYIITRSFLRVADMTKIFNRKAYDEVHNKLKYSSCGRDAKHRGPPGWKACVRSFYATGNQKVRIKLTRKSEKTGKKRTEWAYAPHLGLSRSAWGPLDLVPVPVNREECVPSGSMETPAVPDEPSVNITWTIAFAGRSPAKLMVGNALGRPGLEYNMTDIKANLLETQSLTELAESVAGHHLRDDYHPRRESALSVVASILLVIESLFEIHYWYTRSSTVGISISGIYLVSIATIVNSVFHAAWNTVKDEETVHFGVFNAFLFSLIWKVGSYIGAFAMLRAITRAEMYWWKSCIPLFRVALPTHAERASQRIDSRVTYRFKTTVFAVLAAFFYFVHYKQYFLIDPRGPTMPPKNKAVEILSSLPYYTVCPATALGWMLQIIFNYRTKTFAGAYAVAVHIRLVWSMLALMAQSPWIVGETTIGSPFKYYSLLELIWWAVLAFQASTYSSVSEVDEEEETR